MRWKIIELRVGDPIPKYAVLESHEYKKELERYMRINCLNSEGTYYNDPVLWKQEREQEGAGQPQLYPCWALILEEDPEMNEFGEVSP